jgi:hypothetical protein
MGKRELRAKRAAESITGAGSVPTTDATAPPPAEPESSTDLPPKDAP